jgi:hypothetical protein
LNEVIEKAFFTVLGGGIAAGIGMIVSDYKRKKDARSDFAVTMSELYGESLSSRNLMEFHGKTLERVRRAVFRVRPFVRTRNVGTFDWLWAKYQTIDAEALNPEYESELIQELYAIDGETPPPIKPTRAISLYIKKFCDLVH